MSLESRCHNESFLLYTRVTSSTFRTMTHDNLTHAVLCTDAYIVNVRRNTTDNTSSIFDVALPCGNHLLANNQPVLLCSLQYQTVDNLPHVPAGLYHIRAKVCTPRLSTSPYPLHLQIIPFVPATFPTSPLWDDAAFALMGDLIRVHLLFFSFLTLTPLYSVLTAVMSRGAR